MGTTTESLDVLEGHWRACVGCVKVLQCLDTNACVGGNASTCLEGHTGAYCSVCDRGYYSAHDGCRACSEAGYVGTLLAGVGVLVVGVALVCCLQRCALRAGFTAAQAHEAQKKFRSIL